MVLDRIPQASLTTG